MKLCPFRFWTFSGSALFWVLASYPVTAQIVPDTTLPSNSIVTPEGNTFNIRGGTPGQGNLFHSFKEFSIRAGETAHFNNAVDIANIISRVTGGSISNIDGLIRANGTANLFFINPSGIVFGPNASLQIGGSFVASTADSLKFEGGKEFSATNPQAPPLLTVSVPLGLQFGSNPREIVNRSTPGLQLLSGKTLALVGGNVTLEGGNLTVADGRIELGSVGTGLVNLTEIPQGYALGYSGVQNFQDILLSNGALIGVSGEGGGGIQVQGRNINLTGGAAIFSQTLGAGTGGTLTVDAAGSVNLSGDSTSLFTYTQGTGSAGNLTITTRKLTVENGASIQTPSLGQGQAGDLLVKASDAVELSGTTADGQSPSGLSAQVFAEGNGGNLTVETGRLTIRDGALIEASTFGAGRAGNVRVTARDVQLEGVGPTQSSGIFAQVAENAIENAGDAGTLTIETGRLSVLGGAKISTATFQGGNGGDLTINATDSITLSGASPLATADPLDPNRSGIFASAEKGARGNVGNLTINTGLLSVENGAKISADNLGSGQGETQSAINVRQLVIRDGGQIRSGSFAEGPGGTLTVNATESVSVIGAGTIGSEQIRSTLSAAATASGKAGDLNITTPSLNVQNEGQVTVSGEGSGSAGNLTVTANDLRLNRGTLSATTNAGEGANITLRNLNLLLLQNQSLISAQAFNNANGGNIDIFAPNGFVVAVPGQDNNIIASAIVGRGGEINITTSGIFGIDEREQTSVSNDIDASSQFGLAGSVNINRPDVEPPAVLPELSTVLVDASALVDTSSCAAFADSEGSSFIITGRGGLPPSPNEPLSPDVVWSDTRIPKITTQRSQITTPPPSDSHVGAIVPATGWVFNGKGQVTLISHASRTPGLGSTPAKCPKQ
jgi:filamentous hemagglutinin family protein